MSTLFSRRRSSFGAFTAHPPMDAAHLATVLCVAAQARSHRCDLKPDGVNVPWTRLSVLANHVAGVSAGCYRYDSDVRRLCRSEPGVAERTMSDFLESCHVLTNHNLEQVAAVLAISGRLDAMLSTYGGRGYRILNAEAGTVAQAGYLAATALGIGCGAVLGIDNMAVDEVLGFDGTDERSLLFLLVGPERPVHAHLNGSLDMEAGQ